MLKEIKTKVNEERIVEEVEVVKEPEPLPEEKNNNDLILALSDLMFRATHNNRRRIQPEMEVVVPVVEKSDARVTNSVITSLSAIATWAVLSLLLL